MVILIMGAAGMGYGLSTGEGNKMSRYCRPSSCSVYMVDSDLQPGSIEIHVLPPGVKSHLDSKLPPVEILKINHQVYRQYGMQLLVLVFLKY